MLTRKLLLKEYDMALNLAWRVFERFEAPEYSDEGVENFRKTIQEPSFSERICCYGAFDENQLVGMLATRNEGAHIALFFVEEAYHRRGIGRDMFALALSASKTDAITVNSSPFAVQVYRQLGFVETKPEQLLDGIRFTPMIYEKTHHS